jgi:integrase
MHFAELPAFMADLKGRPALAARSLELTILTAARTSEVLQACWDEIDLTSALWVIPGNRMKAGREHRVPLSPQAVAVLAGLPRVSPLVFPGQRQGRPLSNMVMEMLLRRMGREDCTVHGFRSTFRDWVAEETDFSRELAELSLAHVVGSAVERAYRRSDMLERRRTLMNSWANALLNQ